MNKGLKENGQFLRPDSKLGVIARHWGEKAEVNLGLDSEGNQINGICTLVSSRNGMVRIVTDQNNTVLVYPEDVLRFF